MIFKLIFIGAFQSAVLCLQWSVREIDIEQASIHSVLKEKKNHIATTLHRQSCQLEGWKLKKKTKFSKFSIL